MTNLTKNSYLASALQCVVCNSLKDGDACADWDTLSFITECPDDGAGGNKTMCAKIEQWSKSLFCVHF